MLRRRFRLLDGPVGHRYNLDPRAAEAAITDRTTAIIAVHIAGCPADMDAFKELARRRGLALIEDAAQAHAAEWRGRRVGALGDAGTFSFQASKNLNAGEGGIVLTDRPEVYDRAWSLINVGRVRDGGRYEHALLSGNYRMTEWQGALLLSQMRRLEEQTQRRNENAPLFIDSALGCTTKVVTLKHHHRRIKFRFLADLFFETQPFIQRINVKATHARDIEVGYDNAIIVLANQYFTKF